MFLHTGDQDDLGVDLMGLGRNMGGDLFESLHKLEFGRQIRDQQLSLLAADPFLDGTIFVLLVDHTERLCIQLIFQVLFALDRFFPVREVHEYQNQRSHAEDESAPCLRSGGKRGIRSGGNGGILQDLHDHLRRNILGQCVHVVHDGADGAVGILWGVRRHAKRHQVGAIDHLRTGGGAEGIRSQILADFLFQQVAVEDIGKAVGHGGSCGKIAVGIIAGGFGGDHKGRGGGIGVAEVGANGHIHDHGNCDGAQEDRPQVAKHVPQDAEKIQPLQQGGELIILFIFVHASSSTTTNRDAVP